MTTIHLGYDSPPLRSNSRHHWAYKAAVTRRVREAAAWAAKADGPVVPIAGSVTVTLIWTVTDNRRRDAGASSPTLKAALDGIVDAGLLPGDHHQIVREERCRIEVGTTPGVRIEIEAAS